jgi:hypothetical protein
VWHVSGKEEDRTGFCWGDQRGRGHLEDVGIDRIILKWILRKSVEVAWTGIIWLRIDACCGVV